MRQFTSKFLLLCLLVIVCIIEAKGQNANKGTAFWCAYSKVFNGGSDKFLVISAEVATAGSIQLTSGWNQNFNVPAGGSVEINVPAAEAEVVNSEIIEDKGIYIEADNEVNVIATMTEPLRTESSLIFPVEFLGSQHTILSYPGYWYGPSSFLIVADEDNTTIEITPSQNTDGGQAAGVPFMVTLNRGQSYMVSAPNANGDMSGSLVDARGSRIAVFAGNGESDMPLGCGPNDPLYEQLPSYEHFGTSFVIPPFPGQNGSIIRIVSTNVAAAVSLNGGPANMVQVGDYLEMDLSNDVHCITSDNPVLVVQYMKGSNCNDGPGDPSFVTLAPVGREVKEACFTPFSSTGTFASYRLTLVVPANGTTGVELDGTALNGFINVPGCNNYAYTTVNVNKNTHFVHSCKGFVAYLIGYGSGQESYVNQIAWGSKEDAVNVQASVDTTICENNTPIEFCATNADNYTWVSLDNGTINGPSDVSCISVSVPSDTEACFEVTGSDAFGCSSKDTTCVKVGSCNTTLTVTASDVRICKGEDGQLNAFVSNSLGIVTYSWTPTTGLNDASIADPTVSNVNQTTTYVVTVADDNGTHSDTIVYTVEECNNNPCGGDTLVVCVNNPSFEGPAGMGTDPPSWSSCGNSDDGVNSIDIQPNQGLNDARPATDGDTYVGMAITNTNFGGFIYESVSQQMCEPLIQGETYCFDVDICGMKIPGGAADFEVAIFVGNGECTEEQEIYRTPVLNVDSDWGTYSICFEAAGNYTHLAFLPVILTDGSAYIGIDNIVPRGSSTEPCGPKLTATGDEICIGEAGQLTATATEFTGIVTYNWSPTNGLDDPISPNPVVNGVDETRTYIVTITDDNGTASDTVELIVKDCSNPCGGGDSTSICVVNPSFEGTPGMVTNPDDWGACGDIVSGNNSIDVLPNAGYQFVLGKPAPQASDGNTYVGMFVGDEGSGPYYEGTTQLMCAPLEQGKSYCFDIDIMGLIPDDLAQDGVFEIAIYGGTNECGEEQEFFRTPQITATETWNTYSICFDAIADYTHISFRPFLVSGVKAYVGLDNIVPRPAIGNPCAPEIDAIGDTICTSQTAQLTSNVQNAEGFITYNWSPGTNLNDSTIANPAVIGLTQTTEFTVIVQDDNGSDTAMAIVVVEPCNPTVVASGDTICRGYTAQLTSIVSDPTGIVTYSWSPGSNLNDSTLANPIVIGLTQITNFTVIIQDEFGADTATTTIDVIENPAIVISGDTIICRGGSTEISASGAFNYVWNNGLPGIDGPHAVSPDTLTNYQVIGTNEFGCKDTASITVDVQSISINVEDQSGCNIDTLNICVIGGATHSWTAIDGGVIVGRTNLACLAVASPDPSSVNDLQYCFEVVGQDELGCETRDTACAIFEATCKPSVRAIGDTICDGDTAELTTLINSALGVISYNWSPGIFLNDSTVANPLVNNITENTVFTVVISAENGSDTAQALVLLNNEPPLTITTDTSICLGDSALIEVNGALTYNWDNGLGNNSSYYVSPLTSTIYTVVGIDSNSCSGEVQVDVLVNELPIVKTSDTSVCFEREVTLQASGGTDYSWLSLDDGNIIDGQNSANVTVSTSLSNPLSTVRACFQVRVSDANDCVNFDTACVDFTLECGPEVEILAEEICVGEAVTLQASVIGGEGDITYLWSGGNLNNASGPIQNDTPSINTIYQVVVMDSNGDGDTASILVTVHPLPDIDAGEDQIICEGEETLIQASGGVSYMWNQGLGNGASHTIRPLMNTIYTVSGTDQYGCEYNDDVIISIEGVFLQVGPDKSICKGDTISVTVDTDGEVSWMPAQYISNPSSAQTQLYPLESTMFNVTAENTDHGCSVADSFMVYVQEVEFNAQAIPSVIDEGESSTLVVNSNEEYAILWYEEEDIWLFDGTSLQNLEVSPLQTTNYNVFVTDSLGCDASALVTVKVQHKLRIPNVFTPNGDGQNDKWIISYLEDYDENIVHIYNRWGNRVFSVTDYKNNWSGNSERGANLPAGTYYFEIILPLTKERFSGDLTILR